MICFEKRGNYLKFFFKFIPGDEGPGLLPEYEVEEVSGEEEDAHHQGGGGHRVLWRLAFDYTFLLL